MMSVAYSQMVALGSSFAAGPGLKPIENRPAMRSQRNYAHLVANHLGASLIDATISGATTATILQKPQRATTHVFPPQIESVHAETDLVTVTAGGNDLGYLGGVLLTSLLGQFAHWRLSRPAAELIRSRRVLQPVTPEQRQGVTDGLVHIVNRVRAQAPASRVVLVDYLPVFTQSTTGAPGVPLTVNELEHFRGVAADLSEAYAEASRRTGADLVPASVYGQGHGAGSAVPWVNDLRIRSLASSFHPTLAGMQAVADAILDHLATAEAEPR